MDEAIAVYADRRWPRVTSVAEVQTRYDRALPAHMRLVDLRVQGRIGSPLSPLRITQAILKAHRGGRGVSFSAGWMPPLWSPVPSVVVVHDLTHLHTYGPTKKLYYETVLRPLFRKCAAVICVSDYTKSALLDWAGLAPKRVHVVPNGPPDIAADGPRHAPGYRYVFHCSNQRPHKNLGRLVEAYCRSRLPREGIKLVLTNGANPDLVRIAAAHGLQDNLVFAGYLPTDALQAYYRGAEAVAFVSLFEGFGLPILEGYATGVPVLTSTVTAMPEVAGGGALLVDPYSVTAIAEGLERITRDTELRADLVDKGRRRLADFDWTRSAARVWEIVEAAAREGAPKVRPVQMASSSWHDAATSGASGAAGQVTPD